MTSVPPSFSTANITQERQETGGVSIITLILIFIVFIIGLCIYHRSRRRPHSRQTYFKTYRRTSDEQTQIETYFRDLCKNTVKDDHGNIMTYILFDDQNGELNGDISSTNKQNTQTAFTLRMLYYIYHNPDIPFYNLYGDNKERPTDFPSITWKKYDYGTMSHEEFNKLEEQIKSQFLRDNTEKELQSQLWPHIRVYWNMIQKYGPVNYAYPVMIRTHSSEVAHYWVLSFLPSTTQPRTIDIHFYQPLKTVTPETQADLKKLANVVIQGFKTLDTENQFVFRYVQDLGTGLQVGSASCGDYALLITFALLKGGVKGLENLKTYLQYHSDMPSVLFIDSEFVTGDPERWKKGKEIKTQQVRQVTQTVYRCNYEGLKEDGGYCLNHEMRLTFDEKNCPECHHESGTPVNQKRTSTREIPRVLEDNLRRQLLETLENCDINYKK